MAIKQGPGNFEQYNDPMGNELIALGRDGSVFSQAITFPDGTSQTTAAAGNSPAAANTILAGPLSGGSSTPAFRALTAADLPNLTTIGGLPLLSGASFTSVAPQIVGTGNIDLYTVPAGKRAYVTLAIFNPTGGGINYIPKINISGTYYSAFNGASIGANVFVSVHYSNYVFEAGEIVAINTGGSGLAVRTNIMLFDAASPYRTVKAVLTSGANTIYTVPPGKMSIAAGQLGFTNNAAASLLTISNDTTASRTYTANAVPSAGSVSTTNQIMASAAVTGVSPTNLVAAVSIQVTLGAGDFVSVTSSSTGQQLAFYQVNEF